MMPEPKCPGCGEPLPPDALIGFCPSCLLAVVESDEPTLFPNGVAKAQTSSVQAHFKGDLFTDAPAMFTTNQVGNAISAMQLGALKILIKPLDPIALHDQLVEVIRELCPADTHGQVWLGPTLSKTTNRRTSPTSPESEGR